MSEREKLAQLIDNIPDYKIGYIIAYVEGISAEEQADNDFCEELYQDYINSPVKDESYTLDDCKKEWGID